MDDEDGSMLILIMPRLSRRRCRGLRLSLVVFADCVVSKSKQIKTYVSIRASGPFVSHVKSSFVDRYTYSGTHTHAHTLIPLDTIIPQCTVLLATNLPYNPSNQVE